jgi:hypothetical protein
MIKDESVGNGGMEEDVRARRQSASRHSGTAEGVLPADEEAASRRGPLERPAPTSVKAGLVLCGRALTFLEECQ